MINIATGVVASLQVNVDEALEIGMLIQKQMDGKKWSDITFKKSDQVKTFMIMRKPVKLQDEEIYISSSELFQRLIATVRVDGPPDPEIFLNELAPVSQHCSTI